MALIKELTDDTFDQEVLGAGPERTLVEFYGENCSACRVVMGLLEDLIEEPDNRVRVMKLNVNRHAKAAARLNIRGLPALLLFQDGRELRRMAGVGSRSAIKTFVAEERTPASPTPNG